MIKRYPNFIKGKKMDLDKRGSNGEINHYLTGEPIGYFPDIDSKTLRKAIGGSKKLHKKWNKLNRPDKIEMLNQAGEEMRNKNDLDEMISGAGGFPAKFVSEARKTFGDYLKNSEDYLQSNPGKGPCAAATSVTGPEVQPFVMIESILGNSSITIKGDGSEPFSAYLVSEIGNERGLPVQFITYNSKEKSDFSKKLFDSIANSEGSFILMGDEKTPKKVAYGDRKDIDSLPIPKNMIAFTSHGGGMYVSDDADPEEAARGAVDSFRFPKSCKAPRGIFVGEKIKEDFKNELTELVKRQRVGKAENEKTDIAEVSEGYWKNMVEPFIKTASAEAEITNGGEMNQPTIMEGEFNSSLSMEPRWPVYCMEEVEDYKEALEKLNLIGKNFPGGKALDLSVYSDKETFDKLVNKRKNGELNFYTLHFNKPTNSIHSVQHEGKILRQNLSEPDFVNY